MRADKYGDGETNSVTSINCFEMTKIFTCPKNDNDIQNTFMMEYL